MRTLNTTIPLGITLAYRLIPGRGHLPYFGRKPSSSHLAVRWIKDGGGWAAFFCAAVQDECRLAEGSRRWG